MSRSPEFTAALAAFQAAAQAAEDARTKAYEARQAHQKADRGKAGSLRASSAGQAAELNIKLEALRGKATQERAAFDEASVAHFGQLTALGALLDPRERAGELDDALPILLLPLRIEARFAPEANELWIRAFPDSWAVDGFEPVLSETETLNAQAFWADFWAAGGSAEMQMAAWRNLVASHGSGRATWIATRYRPVNEADRPGDAPANTLTMAVDGARPSQTDADAITAYWQAIWREPDSEAVRTAANAALEGILGAAGAAQVAASPPRRFADPFTAAPRNMVTLRLVWIEWPTLAEDETKAASWTEAARTDMLPERLVITLQSEESSRSEIGGIIPPVVTLGFDPGTPDADQFVQVDGELQMPDSIAWIFDFDKAVAMGLGLRIALTAAERSQGFKRILVCGLCLRDEADASRVKLETLFAHHGASATGIALLPQGVPTNNSETDSGWSSLDDVEGSFERLFGSGSPALDEPDPDARLDGQWLAHWLGLDKEAVAALPNASGRDQLEARAMNRVLFPATIGYSLDSLLDGVLPDGAQASTRRYFESTVLARDCVPQIRIGKQPYGILPASAWSRQRWFGRKRGQEDRTLGFAIDRFLEERLGDSGYLNALFAVLRIADAQWHDLVPGAANMGRPGDLHQTLLDILGLAPNSLEFHRRTADSMEHFFNLMRAQGLGGLVEALIAGAKSEAALRLLRDMGYEGEERPKILRFIFNGRQEAIGKLLVDDVEPSESAEIRFYTDDNRNYLRWLVDAGNDSLEALRVQHGFSGDELPTALLYHLTRHALQLEYAEVGLRLDAALATPTLSDADRRAARTDASFLHIAEQSSGSESRYFHLYQPAPALTGNADRLLQEHVALVLPNAAEAAEYRAMLAALERLEEAPTARLERLLIEHLDLCTYRLDAWKQGVLQLQLEFMREHHPGRPPVVTTTTAEGVVVEEGRANGLYLGAYGWLEDVRPRTAALTPANVPADLRETFRADKSPMVEDSANLGYIHAPSLDQAQTAAVLRNSYVANAEPAHPGTMAVNLSSWRVRQATALLEGMRNDQSLSELLGYRLERDLHDNFALAETDEFIFALRARFPLVANRMASTYEDLQAGESIETIEARNVVDGEKLLRHIGESGENSYPFGLADLPVASDAQRQKIDAAVELLANVSDAVADLALSESVYQAMKGKPEGAAAVLDAQGSGLFPPVSEFVATPREGVTLTLRTALFLDPAAAGATAWDGIASTPRSEAEPVLNHWLKQIFPAPEDIVVEAEAEGGGALATISLADLGRQPIDWLYELRLDEAEASAALDLLVEAHFRSAQAPVDPKAPIAIRYRADVAGKISLFRFAPLVDSARTLVTTTRPLGSDDLALANQKAEDREGDSEIPRARASDAVALLTSLADDAGTFAAPLTTALEDRTANAAGIRAGLEARLTAFEALARRAGLLGLTELDPSIGLRWRRRWFAALDGRLASVIADWERRLAEFQAQIARFDSVPLAAPFGDIFSPLQRAERQISTTVTQPLPADPVTMRADLVARAATFEERLDKLRDAHVFVTDDADSFLAKVEEALPLAAFVPDEFAVADEIAAFAEPTAEMAAAAATLAAAIAKRRTAAEGKLAAHDSAVEPKKKVAAMGAALKAIFGDSFVALPLFTLAPAQQAELALCAAAEADLLQHQTGTVGDSFPLETWLHSAARVRDRVAGLEYLGFLGEALTGAELPLTAWQLPHAPGDAWLGAAYPDDLAIDGDRLLVHAHHAAAFAPAGPQAGLLIDEWTEVIPTRDILTGVAFHFDRPNSEPPQAFLLMTPTDFRGGWTWEDIVDGLNETLDAAKQRAVEPAQLDATAFAPLLPATLAATVHHPLSIALNYAAVNGFARLMAEGNG